MLLLVASCGWGSKEAEGADGVVVRAVIIMVIILLGLGV